MQQQKIAVLVGSLRKDSINKIAAKALIALAPKSLSLDIVEIGDLALFNEDLDTSSPPESWTRFRTQMSAYAGFLFVTPEYNRSMPAALKNAIDVGSRPWGKSIWNGKPAAVVSVSPSPMGGYSANQHLRQALMVLNVPSMVQPEAYIGNCSNLFDANGNVVNESTRDHLKGFMEAFAEWVKKLS